MAKFQVLEGQFFRSLFIIQTQLIASSKGRRITLGKTTEAEKETKFPNDHLPHGGRIRSGGAVEQKK